MNFLNSFKTYFSKEIVEGIRAKKFIILAIGVLIFSLSDPILLKLMPEILKNQMEGMDLTAFFELSQRAAMQNYTGNLFQLSTLIIVLSMMGIIAKERSDKTLTIPVSMGCSINGMVLAKLLVYGVYILIINVLGMLIAYYYSGIIFGFTYGSFFAAIVSGLAYGFFFIFVLSVLIFMSSFVKKSFLAVTITLLFVYLMPFFSGIIDSITRYVPTNLLTEANYFVDLLSKDMFVSLISTIALVVIFIVIAVVKLEKVEFI
ncbi:UNVERIFIED_CONTAM: ABC-2 type transport system permease protein [Acetivibrio alkalicellulosi]